MIVTKETVWLIMSKDRKFVAKGAPRNRSLVAVDDMVNKERYLTYTSEGRARSAYKVSGFYGQHLLEDYSYHKNLEDLLEPVECEITIVTKE